MKTCCGGENYIGLRRRGRGNRVAFGLVFGCLNGAMLILLGAAPGNVWAQAQVTESWYYPAGLNHLTKKNVGEPRCDAARLIDLSKKYGIEVVTKKPIFPVKLTSGVIDGKEADTDQLDAYFPIFESEWNLYPVSLVQRSRLKRIVFCRNLSFAGQLRAAIPDFENDTLYFDVVRGMHAEQYVRKVVHHEYYHLIDLRDDGLLYEDDRWAQLNPKGFKYGAGGRSAQQDRLASLSTSHIKGFLNTYSMTGVEEDKAEMFAHMMAEPKAVAARASDDTVIRAKVERMKELMQVFCPAMDKQFWADLPKVRERALKKHELQMPYAED